MKGIWAWALLAGFVAGCGSPGASSTSPAPGEAVELRLESVVARQYRGAELRFEFAADELVLDEAAERIEARGSVRGLLLPELWPKEQP